MFDSVQDKDQPAAAETALPTTATAPLRVAICGEASSGKSALIDGLMRQLSLPDLFGLTERPTIHIHHGGAPGWTGVFEDGHEEALDPVVPLPLGEGLTDIHIHTGNAMPHLAGLELVEFAPLNHESIPAAQIERLGGFDVMIWTTIGSQAWRLSEKTIIEALGPTRPDHMALAITRADKFRKDADREKVLDRVRDHVAGLFDTVVLTGASTRAVAASETSDDAWRESGLAELFEWIASVKTANLTRRSQSAEVVHLDTFRPEPELATAAFELDDLTSPEAISLVVQFTAGKNSPPLVLKGAPDLAAGYTDAARSLICAVRSDDLVSCDMVLGPHHLLFGFVGGSDQIVMIVSELNHLSRGMARTIFERQLSQLGTAHD